MIIKNKNLTEIFHNIVIGLAVSFVALSLGAAFGILSGRPDGAFIGMLSAGLIAFITSIFGGTRIQCSGPTGPMTTVTIATVKAATIGVITAFSIEISIGNPQHFVNLVIFLSGVLLILSGIFRIGRFIQYVPQEVISGFMNGIALIIFFSQINKLFGLNNINKIDGNIFSNVFICLLTVLIIIFLPLIIRRFFVKISMFLPGTLMGIIISTFISIIFFPNIETVELNSTISSITDISLLIKKNIPTDWSVMIIFAALPLAFQISMLAYLDTLLTSLIVDRMNKEKTSRNKELIAQGLGNSIVSFFGGIPGAQATIRSVLIVKEGATMRLGGIMVGIFVLVEMMLLTKQISLIPQAVFSGVLIKVAYDVFDWGPIIKFVKISIFKDKPVNSAYVWSIFIVLGCTLLTLFINLNFAVIFFTALFYILRIFGKIKFEMVR